MLNFAKVPFRNERLPRLIYGLAVTALVVATLIHGITLTRYLLREQEELDVKVAELEAKFADLRNKLNLAETELNSKTDAVRTERIRFLSDIYRQKSFPWTGLFNKLETLTPPGVRIASISPGEPGDEVGEIEVNIQVVGRTLGDVLEMVKRLEADQLFTTVLPLRESENDREGGGGIAAALTLQYLRSRAELPPAPALPAVGAVEEEMEDDSALPPGEESPPDIPKPTGAEIP